MPELPHDLPTPPRLRHSLGPSFILLGLALGSGELILWPYLAATYGLGLMWGALLGLSFQYVLNTEAMRYTLQWGESVFVGFRRMHKALPIWFLLSTFIPWSIPGFSSASAQLINHLVPELDTRLIAALLLLATGGLLTLGSSLYKTMERMQRTIIMLGLPFMLVLVLAMARPIHWQELAEGFLGYGAGWRFFPPAVALSAFLGAFAYAGAGGNLNLAQSYYIKEKGFGMGKYLPKISSLILHPQAAVHLEGHRFRETPENRQRWKAWWRLVTQEHLLIFWLLGLISISILSVLARATVHGTGSPQGINFLFTQAQFLGNWLSPLQPIFLAVTATLLFGTQLGVLESSARIVSENVLLLFHKSGQKHNISHWFYVALWGQIGLGLLVLAAGITEPRFLITLAALLNAAAMMVAFVLVGVLNYRLPQVYRPNKARLVVLGLAAAFFAYFLVLTVASKLAG